MASYMADMWSLALHGELQGIWFWAALYAFLMCGYSVVYQLRVHRWPSTSGMLHNVSIEIFGYTESVKSEQEYRVDAHYTYRVAGQDYAGRRVSPWIVLVGPGLEWILRKQLAAVNTSATGAVQVFYNPKRPAKSFLVLPSKLGVWITLVLSLVLGLGYLHRFYL